MLKQPLDGLPSICFSISMARGGKVDNVTISFLEKSDVSEAARVLSMAMAHNPINLAVYQGGGESERKAIEEAYREILASPRGILFAARVSRDLVGVMRMISCDGGENVYEDVKTEDFQDTRWRKSFWHREWDRHDPAQQHWHLGPVAVLPDYQGKRIGMALMNRFCREVDACFAAAYLETDGTQNVSFYRKFGFEVIGKSDIFQVPNGEQNVI